MVWSQQIQSSPAKWGTLMYWAPLIGLGTKSTYKGELESLEVCNPTPHEVTAY